MEGNVDPVVQNLASELANISISNLSYLCESMPKIKLYVSNEVHTELANSIK